MNQRISLICFAALFSILLPLAARAQRGPGGGGGGNNNNNNNSNRGGSNTGAMVLTAGGMLEVYPFASRQFVSPITFEETYAAMYTLGALAYYPLVHHEDWVSLGVEGGLNVGFRFNRAIGTDFIVQVPAYITGRIGAGATGYNTQTLGFALGVGLQPSYVRMGFLGELDMGSGQSAPFKARLNNFLPAPSAMFEVSFRNYVFRLHGSLMRSNVNMDFDANTFTIPEKNIPISLGNYGLGLMFRF
jgi:hypothetical protein